MNMMVIWPLISEELGKNQLTKFWTILIMDWIELDNVDQILILY